MPVRKGEDKGLDKSPRVVERMFDLITPTYDRLNSTMSFSTDRRWRARALKELAANTSDRVLDVATGTGDMALEAARTCGCTIIGVDLSRNMLRSAVRKWSQERGDDRYSAVQGDAIALPFRDASFDRTMVAFGIRNMDDIGAFLGEAHRVLRPGGRLVVLELSVPSSPVVRPVFLAHLTKILPMVARAQGGDAVAYRYLSESVATFPPAERILALAEARGFQTVLSERLSLGACHLYVLDKGR